MTLRKTFLRLIGAFALGLTVLGASPAAAQGDDFATLVAQLAGGDFAARVATVRTLAERGDPRAVPVLEALAAGLLFIQPESGQVVMGAKRGAVFVLTDPADGAEMGQTEEKDLGKIRVNNQLRAAIRGALGGLTLLSDDPARRAVAADAVFRSGEADIIAVLVKAIERETVPKIAARLERALAAVVIRTAPDEGARIEAMEAVIRFPDPEVRALLAALGHDPNIPETLRERVAEAQAAIERRLAWWGVVGNLFQGISLGSVLLLAAVGLAITFGVMGVINMAHGELVMLGAYTTFVVQNAFRTYAPDWFDWSLMVAIPAAFAVAGGAGVAIERGIIRFLYGRPLETLLATWGLSLILQQLVRTVFGPTNREVGSPAWMSGAIETSGGLVLTYNRIAIIVFALAVLILIALILRRTEFGLRMRAVTQNRRMAGSMGIATGRIDMLTFGLGSGVAGMAGVALSQIDNVSPNLGQAYIIDSFMVVVFGGVGNLWGTLVGAFSLGIVNKFLEPVAGAVLAKILVLVAIILFIQKRPRGLFALKGRAVEG